MHKAPYIPKAPATTSEDPSVHSLSELSYVVDYSKRKTVEVTIDTAGRIRVLAPKGTSDVVIDAVVKERRPWIDNQLKALNTVLQRVVHGPKEKSWAEGEKFLYLGKAYPIRIVVCADAGVELARFNEAEGQLEIHTTHTDEAFQRNLLKKAYKKACRNLITSRLNHFQPLMGLKAKAVLIEESHNKWGSCNNLGHLMFNWRLIMAPTDVIDYIVVHELCHLRHMNHDRSFWRLVGKYCPDHEKKQAWLACYSLHMTL